MAVSADGTLLRDSSVTGALPTIAVGVAPGGTHVSGAAMAEVRLLAAAPYRLLATVSQVSSDATHGLTAQLRNGPKLYFGGADQLAAKWASAAAVLASAGSAGADYIDVSVASRPAAGTGADTAQSPATGAGVGTTGGAGNERRRHRRRRRHGGRTVRSDRGSDRRVTSGRALVWSERQLSAIVESSTICNDRCESMRTVELRASLGRNVPNWSPGPVVAVAFNPN